MNRTTADRSPSGACGLILSIVPADDPDVNARRSRKYRALSACSLAARLGVWCWLLTLSPFIPDVAAQSESAPDIVVILVDDMGFSDIGAVGGEAITPNIDALADDGLLLPQFYNSARCWPTRASLLTGRYHHRAGVGGGSPREDTPIEPGPYQGFLNENPTFAEVLRDAGYGTYMSGKWHVGARPEEWPTARGFDRYFGLISGASSYFELITDQPRIRRMASDGEYYTPPPHGFYMTTAFTDSALSFVRSHVETRPDDPFMLYLAYTAPHWPLHALDEDIAAYEGRFDAGWDSVHAQRYRRMLELGVIDRRHVPWPRPDSFGNWADTTDHPTWARRMEVHAAMIHRVDIGIGRLVDLLEETGRFDNTLILFISDNGASAENVEHRGLHDQAVPIGERGSYDAYREPWAYVSNTPFRRYKASMYEGGVRTPLIAHWPDGIQNPGRLDSEVGHVVDITPTLYDVANVESPVELDGLSIVPVFNEGRIDDRNVYWEHLGHRAMRTGDLKIVYDTEDELWELYDLSVDPTELHNLADEQPGLTDSLESIWAAWADTSDVRYHDKPNILVLVADDAGWDDFGAYGSPAAKTPHIDALAASGVTFDRAILTTPQCSPSRISILTGKYPHQTGAEDLHMPLPEDEVLLPAILNQIGYVTGHMHKTHYGPNGEAQFDWYSGDLADFSAFLDSAGRKPFFMWVGFTDPHRPYTNTPIARRHDPASVVVPAHLIDNDPTRRDLADYLDEIARMDSVIGSYVAELEARSIADETLVIFLSDNGAPFPRAKGSLYDAGIRTPLIFSWPGRLPRGARRGGVASVIDLAPTVAEVAGLEIPDQFEGASLWEAVTGKGPSGRRFAYSERNWHNCDEHQRSVTTSKFKLIKNAYLDLPACTAADISRSPSWRSLFEAKGTGELGPEQRLLFDVPRPLYELYDLSEDPHEYHNLASDPAFAGVASMLIDVLDDWMYRTDDFPPERRRRADNTDRVTGVKFTTEIPPMVP